jgi:hypothetical protein
MNFSWNDDFMFRCESADLGWNLFTYRHRESRLYPMGNSTEVPWSKFYVARVFMIAALSKP